MIVWDLGQPPSLITLCFWWQCSKICRPILNGRKEANSFHGSSVKSNDDGAVHSPEFSSSSLLWKPSTWSFRAVHNADFLFVERICFANANVNKMYFPFIQYAWYLLSWQILNAFYNVNMPWTDYFVHGRNVFAPRVEYDRWMYALEILKQPTSTS